MVIKPGTFVPQIIGADDGGVSSCVPATYPAPVENSDIRDPVVLDEVVGGRETMPAAADNDDVIMILGHRGGPCSLPAALTIQAFLQQGQGRIAAQKKAYYARVLKVEDILLKVLTANAIRW